jgi:lipoyl(octanoyl) transferase
MKLIEWGIIPYGEAYNRQKNIFEEALQNKALLQTVENKLILCEHFPVITIGKNGMFSNLLFPETTLKDKNVELYHVDRGGDITYHGPGQVVGYPIFDLEFFHIGLKEYISLLEEAIIQTIAEYGIKGERMEKATGVWLDKDNPLKARKIAAIGVRSSRYVTMHGFALNVNTDLSFFKLINPCGFTDKGVTSIQQELGETVDIQKIKSSLFQIIKQLFRTCG